MSIDMLTQQKLFATHKQEKRFLVDKLLEQERPYLYDFLLRMTCNASRSCASIDDSIRNLRSQTWENLSDFRLALYQLCRKYNKGEWKTDVSKLENDKYTNVINNPQESDNKKNQYQCFFLLDREICQLDPLAREVLCLHIRSNFTFSEIAKIIEIDRDQIEKLFQTTISHLVQVLSWLPRDPRSQINELLCFSEPEILTTQAIDLYVLMKGMRKPKHLPYYAKPLLLGAIIIGGITITALTSPPWWTHLKFSLQVIVRLLRYHIGQ